MEKETRYRTAEQNKLQRMETKQFFDNLQRKKEKQKRRKSVKSVVKKVISSTPKYSLTGLAKSAIKRLKK